MTTVKYLWDHRKQRCELVDEPKITQQKQSFYSQGISNQSNRGL